jgi:hypothetical protein
VSLDNNPTSQVSAITSLSLAGMDISPLTSISNSLVPSTRANLLTLNTTVGTLRSSVDSSNVIVFLTFTGADASNTAAQTAGYLAFDAELLAIQTDIGAITNSGGVLDLIDNGAKSLSTDIGFVNTTANDLITLAGTFGPLYDDSIIELQYFAGNATKNVNIVTYHR